MTRQALLVVQATLSVVLVAGATMLARSLDKLQHQDFGYQVAGRVVVCVEQTAQRPITQPKLAALYRQIEERLIACRASRDRAWPSTIRSPTTGAN